MLSYEKVYRYVKSLDRKFDIQGGLVTRGHTRRGGDIDLLYLGDLSERNIPYLKRKALQISNHFKMRVEIWDDERGVPLIAADKGNVAGGREDFVMVQKTDPTDIRM